VLDASGTQPDIRTTGWSVIGNDARRQRLVARDVNFGRQMTAPARWSGRLDRPLPERRIDLNAAERVCNSSSVFASLAFLILPRRPRRRFLTARRGHGALRGRRRTAPLRCSVVVMYWGVVVKRVERCRQHVRTNARVGRIRRRETANWRRPSSLTCRWRTAWPGRPLTRHRTGPVAKAVVCDRGTTAMLTQSCVVVRGCDSCKRLNDLAVSELWN